MKFFCRDYVSFPCPRPLLDPPFFQFTRLGWSTPLAGSLAGVEVYYVSYDIHRVITGVDSIDIFQQVCTTLHGYGEAENVDFFLNLCSLFFIVFLLMFMFFSR